MTRPAGPRPPRADDPYGTGLIGSFAAPALAVVGLLIVSIMTLNLMNGELPFGIGGGPGGGNGGGDGPARTPAPSNVVIHEEDVEFPGTFVYAKAGNIWIQTQDGPRQLTSSGRDSMPSWSPDGQSIYYIETEVKLGNWPVRGQSRNFDMHVPHLMRIAADGSAAPEELIDGEFTSGQYRWFWWMRQPVMAPNGTTIALTSDQPDPTERDVVLQLYNVETGKFSRPDVPVTSPLGHQDPAWRPDGRLLLFVRNGRDAGRGAPVIYRYDTREGTSTPLTTAGYLEPAYSPDGQYVAATRTSAIGTDIVILHPSRGTELLRVTSDGRSWAPVWSPVGDAIAFLHLDGQSVDLHMVELAGRSGAWTVGQPIALTDVSGLDAASRPGWYVPPDELPPAASATPAPSPSS